MLWVLEVEWYVCDQSPTWESEILHTNLARFKSRRPKPSVPIHLSTTCAVQPTWTSVSAENMVNGGIWKKPRRAKVKSGCSTCK